MEKITKIFLYKWLILIYIILVIILYGRRKLISIFTEVKSDEITVEKQEIISKSLI